MTRQRRVAAAGLAILVLLLGLVLPWPGPAVGLLRAGSNTSPGVSLPAQFPSYSALTSSAFTRPAGRAIALYEFGSSELFTSWQTLVAGADRDSYRQLTFDGDVSPRVLLSPDGTQVLLHRVRPGHREFTLLDLATGSTRELDPVTWRHDIEAELQFLAWSPDGRYVAYVVPADVPLDARYFEQRPVEDLAILDLTTGATTRYPELSTIFGAVFAPDSRQLLVQSGRDGWLVTVAGVKVRPVRLPTGAELGYGAAWSPDGTLIATYVDHVAAPGGTGFIDATWSGRTVPAELAAAPVLGWRSADSLLIPSYAYNDADGVDTIAEVSIVDGRQSVLSTFSRAQNCEFWLQRCNPYRIQLATALIGTAVVRPSEPDRGPGPPLVHTGLALLVALVAGALVLLVRRRRTAVTPAEPLMELERTA